MFLQALRTGNKKAIAEFMRLQALQHRIACQHCREQIPPLVRERDFDELTVSFDCPLCGKRNRVAMKSWDSAGPLQPPPAS